MIDIENKVITNIETAFSQWDSKPRVVSVLPRDEAYPAVVYVRMLDNSTYQNSLDNSLKEHHARISFRIECYSNAIKEAKSEVKAMLQEVDNAMQNMKFTRTSYNFIPNINPSYTRAYADYYAIVQEPVTVGKNQVYRMYRK